MRLWLTLAEHAGIRESDFVVFADADTVLVRDIPDFCQGDVVVTLRSPRSSFLLNSGVVGLSSKAIASGFVKEWAARNEVIISDPQRLAAAVSPHGIYGGGDQMALIEMLGLDDPAQRAAYGQLSIRTVPCRQFNACENAIDLDEVRVVHQKAALHKFLLERRPLIGPRKMQDSIFQLRAAIDANQAAIQRMKNNGVCGARIDELYRFRLPRGVKGDLSVPFPVLAAHKAVAAARRMGGRLLRQLKLR
jgi:hypothetical protein